MLNSHDSTVITVTNHHNTVSLLLTALTGVQNNTRKLILTAIREVQENTRKWLFHISRPGKDCISLFVKRATFLGLAASAAVMYILGRMWYRKPVATIRQHAAMTTSQSSIESLPRLWRRNNMRPVAAIIANPVNVPIKAFYLLRNILCIFSENGPGTLFYPVSPPHLRFAVV